MHDLPSECLDQRLISHAFLDPIPKNKDNIRNPRVWVSNRGKQFVLPLSRHRYTDPMPSKEALFHSLSPPSHDTSSTRTTFSCFARFVLRTSSVAAMSFCRIFSCLAQPCADMRIRAMKRAMVRNVFSDGLEEPPSFFCRLGMTSCLRLPRIWVRMCSSSRSWALLL